MVAVKIHSLDSDCLPHFELFILVQIVLEHRYIFVNNNFY